MRRRRLLCAALMLSCLTSCGLSIGPQTRTEYVIARPGRPALVAENRTVRVMPEGASQPVEQDIGGWLVMPREHFDALMRALAERAAEQRPEAQAIGERAW